MLSERRPGPIHQRGDDAHDGQCGKRGRMGRVHRQGIVRDQDMAKSWYNVVNAGNKREEGKNQRAIE